MQVARLGIHLRRVVRPILAGAALDTHGRAQRRQLADHLLDQRTQVHPLEVQLGRALLQAGVDQHLVDQLVEVLDIAIHALQVFAPGLVGLGVGDHLQAEAQARNRGAQLVGHRPHHLALHADQALQLLGHGVEGAGQTPHRVGTLGRRARLEAPAGQLRGGVFQALQAALQAAHQQIEDHPRERQAQRADQHQQLGGIGIHLVDGADFQHPGRVDHAGNHPDRVAVLAQRHHRVALVHPALLVLVQVDLLQGDQAQVEAELLLLLQCCQAPGLLGDGLAHQLVHQQVDGGPRQLLADLLDLGGQQQLFVGIDQRVDPCLMRRALLHQHLAL